MAHASTVTCDFCHKDVTQGTGQHWRLLVQTEQINRAQGDTAPARHNRHLVLPQHHFCNFTCLCGWARGEAEKDGKAQIEFDKRQAEEAARQAAEKDGPLVSRGGPPRDSE